MNKVVLVFLFALLSACGPAQEQSTPVGVGDVKTSGAAGAIYLPDGVGLKLSGDIVSDRVVETKKGKARQVTVTFDKFMRTEIEKSMYDVLKVAKYRRIVREDKFGLLRVSYKKKGAENINANFRTIEAKGGEPGSVRLVLSWREA